MFQPFRSVTHVAFGGGSRVGARVFAATIAPFTTANRTWLVNAHDPTPNDLEIWYDADKIKLFDPSNGKNLTYED